MEFMVNKVALGQVFLRVLGFSPVGIMPPKLLIRHVKILNKRTSGRIPGTSEQNSALLQCLSLVTLDSRRPLPAAAESCSGYTNVRAA